jgi:hypothetical protein
MSAGSCTRCGALVDRIEGDHPDGRTRPPLRKGRAAVPLYPDAKVDLCPPCHVGRGIVDRAVGVEGASAATVWLLVRRRSAWAGWLALAGAPVTLEPRHLADLARTLEDSARTIATCSTLLVTVAGELHKRGAHDMASVVEGIAILLGRRTT